MKNLKYTTFLLLLFVSGIVYFFRKPVQQFLNQAGLFILDHYEESIDLPEAGQPEKEEAENGAEGENGNKETGEPSDSAEEQPLLPEESVSGGDALEWEYGSVDESYFDDALFIGDSRTVGLYDYAGLSNATFFASTGLTVYKLFDAKIVETGNGRQKISVEEALGERQYGKIYLMIGINEMGTGTVESFMKKYGEVVDRLQELQPDALIYLQAIMKVSAERSAKGDYITNEGIEQRNQEIAKLADGRKRFFLDVNPQVCDESGGLVGDYSFDGVHLKAAYIKLWKQYLMEHAVCFKP